MKSNTYPTQEIEKITERLSFKIRTEASKIKDDDMEHELKCIQPHYDNMKNGLKTFELRKNDRNYQVGDTLWQREYNQKFGYTGHSLKVKVLHILCNAPEFGLMEGFCIMSVNEPVIQLVSSYHKNS